MTTKKIIKKKTYVEIEDTFGWKTRFSARESMNDLTITQKCKEESRMIYIKWDELKELIKLLKEKFTFVAKSEKESGE